MKRVGLGPDLDADVVHAGRERLGEPHAERAQAAREDRQVVGVLGPVGQGVGTADDRVGLVVGDRQSDRPRGGQEDRRQPVGRQVQAQPHAALEVTLLDQQPGGLGHPVGIGREGELDAFVARVVVERDEGRPASPRSCRASTAENVVTTCQPRVAGLREVRWPTVAP